MSDHLKRLAELEGQRQARDQYIEGLKARHKREIEQAKHHYNTVAGEDLDKAIEQERNRVLDMMQQLKTPWLHSDYGYAEIHRRRDVVITDETTLLQWLLVRRPGLVKMEVRKALFNKDYDHLLLTEGSVPGVTKVESEILHVRFLSDADTDADESDEVHPARQDTGAQE